MPSGGEMRSHTLNDVLAENARLKAELLAAERLKDKYETELAALKPKPVVTVTLDTARLSPDGETWYEESDEPNLQLTWEGIKLIKAEVVDGG